ncbi:sensor domain-containing phosphodiesterase [Kineococcus sp. NBC_00420]|uniref:putative bifunctional diguanylate cyclase/phosphodiesterase n=1 Tax=Kineococcus sp. NBC_00420 TaxID=2903564 RepID=UPI002E1B99E5
MTDRALATWIEPVTGPEALWWRHSPCAHLVLDPETGLVLAANDTFTAWSGLSREDVVGTVFARLLPVGDRIVWTTHSLPKLTTTGRVDESAVQVMGAGGVRHAAFLSATSLDHAGAPAAGAGPVLIALFAARERRRYEQELLASKRTAETSEARRAVAERHLQHLVHHDPVTGLLNRTGLQAVLTDALASAEAEPGRATVLFLDLDGFKAVNDSVGHAGGDELLKVLGARLRAAVRESAVVARFAGDEFVVLEHLRDEDEAVALCRRLLAELAAPVVVHGVEVVLSASAGIAFADPLPTDGDAARAADDVLRRADTAMYRVKDNGRSGWAVHDPQAGDATADRLRLLQELRAALAEGQLRLHYQPRVRLVDGVTTGVEALIRWEHPTRGLLGPAAFIDVAENAGLIREVGAWVLDTAVAQAAVWNAEPTAESTAGTSSGAGVQMSVNISARQLSDPDLMLLVTSALARHGVPASQLVLEITETALMTDPVAAETTLSALAALGVRIAIDDFGTGYASLTYLQRFPVHELKIDRSFVESLVDRPADRAIAGACVHLARALGLDCVAEGVETAEQRDVLLELGCDLAQGYLFSRPRPAGAHP